MLLGQCVPVRSSDRGTGVSKQLCQDSALALHRLGLLLSVSISQRWRRNQALRNQALSNTLTHHWKKVVEQLQWLFSSACLFWGIEQQASPILSLLENAK